MITRRRNKNVPIKRDKGYDRDYYSDTDAPSTFTLFEAPPRQISSNRPHPLPPRSIASLRTESLGFFIYLSSLFLFYLYIFWAFVPDKFIRQVGIEWYPSREWAVLVPAWTVVFFGMVYVWYLSINIMHTPGISEIATITDRNAVIPSFEELMEDTKVLQRGGIPPTRDLPLGLINKVLFE